MLMNALLKTQREGGEKKKKKAKSSEGASRAWRSFDSSAVHIIKRSEELAVSAVCAAH